MIARTSAWVTGLFRGCSQSGIHFSLNPAVLLALLVATYAAVLALLQPEWWLGGAMWAEMATNYFPTADSHDWRVALFATDAGYIPLPQRLIALATRLAGIRADLVPYVYSFSALILTPLMVGVFALPRFRPLIGCDLVRLAVVFVVLGAADLEIRGFINFTYFAVFFGAVLAALAMHPKPGAPPAWAWLLPVLMLSKPYVLTLLPLFGIGMIFARGRYRWVLGAGILALLAQATRVAISASAGVLDVYRAAPVSLFAKMEALGLYIAGAFGSFTAGGSLWLPFRLRVMISIGALGLCLALLLLLRARHGASALILAGLGIFCGTFVINVFALTSMWGLDPVNLRGAILYRHNFSAFCGFVLIMVGVAQIVGDWLRARFVALPLRSFVVSLIFGVWWATSGWAGPSFAFTSTPGFPAVGASQWQQSALFIDQRGLPVCVPIDPFPWVYGRSCKSLTVVPNWTGIVAIGTDGAPKMSFPVPPEVSSAELRAFAVLISPIVPGLSHYRLQARITYGNGAMARFVASGDLRTGASLAYFIGSFTVRDVKSVELESDTPLGLLSDNVSGADVPVVLWMGL